MIYINGSPILVGDSFENKLVLTDCAKSEVSVLYMDKAYAPKPKTLVFVQIANRNYDSSKATSATNYLYEYQFWMWVEQVLSREFPANMTYDVNNNPIPRPDGTMDLGNWHNLPGVVKVLLYEHKYLLTRQASIDNVNVISRLPLFAVASEAITPQALENGLDWSDIATFLQSSDETIKLDHGVTYTYIDPETEEEVTHPTEYPPHPPYQCYWQQLTLSECLDDLLIGYDCRLLTNTLKYPWDEDLNSVKPWSNLVWKYRRPLKYDETLNYSRIAWPINTTESLAEETNANIHFPKTDIWGSGTPLQIGTSVVNRYDLYHPFYPTLNTVDKDQIVVTEITDYLKRTHVNMSQYYQFTTPFLPAYYYYYYEWSKITIICSKEDSYYEVEHAPRLSFAKQYLSVGQNKHVYGFARYVSGDRYYLHVEDIVDFTNNRAYPGTYILESTNVLGYNNFALNGSPLKGDILSFIITGEVVTFYVEETNENRPAEFIPVLFEGQEVTRITWSCPTWAFNLADSYFEYPDRTLPLATLYDYRYHSHTLVDTSISFATINYDVRTTAANGNFNAPTDFHAASVTLEMILNEADIKTLLDSISTYNTWTSDTLDFIAADWYRRFRFVTFYIGFTKTLTNMDLYFSNLLPQNDYMNGAIHPDMVPSLFFRTNRENGTQITADVLPKTFSPLTLDRNVNKYKIFTTTTFPAYGTLYSLQRMLFSGYLKFFQEQSITVSLTYAD
jgi:hypothetical protein